MSCYYFYFSEKGSSQIMKCQNIYKKCLITLCSKIKQHVLNASWQKCVLQISQARFIHVPLSQRSTWASICWSEPGQSSVFSSATSNQWKFKGLLKDWTKHMWLRRSACQLQGVIQRCQPESICSLHEQTQPRAQATQFTESVESALTSQGDVILCVWGTC